MCKLNDDFDRRTKFCDRMMQKINTKLNFLFNFIAFSDKATFKLNDHVNKPVNSN